MKIQILYVHEHFLSCVLLPVGHDKGHELYVQLQCVCVGVPEVRMLGDEGKDHAGVFLLDVKQVSVHSLWDPCSLQQSVSLLFRPEQVNWKLVYRKLESDTSSTKKGGKAEKSCYSTSGLRDEIWTLKLFLTRTLGGPVS